MELQNFCHTLEDGCLFHCGQLPPELVPDAADMARLWELHPADPPTITMIGKPVKLPRYQLAYGRDYHFSGQTSAAQPVPELLQPLLAWARDHIHDGLNGLLFNWYDGDFGHFIGAHHDSRVNLVPESPIVTVSLGATRVFRLTAKKPGWRHDYVAEHGTVFVLPEKSNAAWKHGVPHFKHNTGRRISVTLRAFK